MTSFVRSFLADEEGATMVEYGIMVALIAAICVAVVKTMGTKTKSGFDTVDTNLP